MTLDALLPGEPTKIPTERPGEFFSRLSKLVQTRRDELAFDNKINLTDTHIYCGLIFRHMLHYDGMPKDANYWWMKFHYAAWLRPNWAVVTWSRKDALFEPELEGGRLRMPDATAFKLMMPLVTE